VENVRLQNFSFTAFNYYLCFLIRVARVDCINISRFNHLIVHPNQPHPRRHRSRWWASFGKQYLSAGPVKKNSSPSWSHGVKHDHLFLYILGPSHDIGREQLQCGIVRAKYNTIKLLDTNTTAVSTVTLHRRFTVSVQCTYPETMRYIGARQHGDGRS